MNINPLDIPGTPFEIELLFPNPTSKRTKDGPVYRLSFQVSEEVHSAFMNAREGNLRLVGYLSVLSDTDEQVELNGKKKAKEPKGAYSYMWAYLHPNGGKGGSGFVTLPGVREAIEEIRETETEPVWEILHRLFGVGGGTLANVGPEEVMAKFPANPRVSLFLDRAMKFQNEKESAK